MRNQYREAANALVAQMTLDEKILQLCHTAPAIERLGIRAYNWWSEALHGAARCGNATVFPQPMAMAASFDPELLQTVGDATADEMRAKYNAFRQQGFTDVYQGITVCAPNINIARDPRWGRLSETYGEDPYLTARMGSAYINGLQGDGEYRKCDAVLKHYAVHSGPEKGRLADDHDASEEELFDTYLYAFAYCIRHADPSMVMPAYNAFRGIPCCANRYLMTEILREKFGFERVTMSDAGAVEHNYKNRKICGSPVEMAALCVNNGTDISIGDEGEGFFYKKLRSAVEQGYITEETITDSVERIFELRFGRGEFFENCPYDQIPYEIIECEEHRKLNRKMAEEGIVLLKNDGILPLKTGTGIAVIGPNADEITVLLGNYHGYPTYRTTFLEGIRARADGEVYFARGVIPSYSLENDNDTAVYEAVIAAQKSDVVVMFMGLNPTMESEECDFDGDRKDLELPENQKKLYEAVKSIGKPIVFVNVSGGCVNLRMQDTECNAVVQCFYPGAEGGSAMASVLFGDVSPSGRLPLTFYESCDDLPDIGNYSMENRTYRFYKGTPVYPFGHGLTYSEIKEERPDENTVILTNHGPYDTAYTVLQFSSEPTKELVNFKRVFLNKNSVLRVTFDVNMRKEPI